MFSSNTSAVSGDAVYIEDVFSTYLYTGNGANRSINNGIDLSTKGGLVWIKDRTAVASNALYDTARGANNLLISNNTNAQNAQTDALTAFNTNGFSLGVDSSTLVNASGDNFASWTFRKQPKFFDVVTWTGNGAASRNISHSLGSVPGCIIVKCTSNGATDWFVYHRSLAVTSGRPNYLYLNATDAAVSGDPTVWPSAPTSTTFAVGSFDALNGNGRTYVAYLFAHDAGGFGLTGTDNVISCGSYTGNGSATGPTITLGYEPQWVLIKGSSQAGNWNVVDSMRGFVVGGNDAILFPNLSNAEAAAEAVTPLPTGFQLATAGSAWNTSGQTYIYIAIRRGPMRTPTTGTSVYENTAYTGNGASNRQIGSSVLTDLLMLNNRDATAQSWATYAQMFFDRLRGDDVSLATASTNAESTSWNSYMDFDMNAGWDTGPTTGQIYLNKSSSTYVSHIFRRAPGFFDVVCYTGTSAGSRAVAHNLGVAPEMVIVKQRTAVGGARSWWVLTTSGPRLNILNDNSAANAFGVPANLFGDATYNNYIAPTATTVTLSPSDEVNSSSNSYIMYLFASCPGVSKVGSYTGDGTVDRVIDCGFTGGARFILLKKTSTTSDWYVYDTARGISSSGEASLSLNSTAAESGVADVIDPASVGFSVGTSGSDFFNESGVSYIFLAIA